MILADEQYLNLQGSPLTLMTELTSIMKKLTKEGVLDKDDLLKAVEISQMTHEELCASTIEAIKKHVNDADIPEPLREFFAEPGEAMTSTESKTEAGDANGQA